MAEGQFQKGTMMGLGASCTVLTCNQISPSRLRTRSRLAFKRTWKVSGIVSYCPLCWSKFQLNIGPPPQNEHLPTEDGGYQIYKAAGKLKGKKAIITGGDSGIGRAVSSLILAMYPMKFT